MEKRTPVLDRVRAIWAILTKRNFTLYTSKDGKVKPIGGGGGGPIVNP